MPTTKKELREALQRLHDSTCTGLVHTPEFHLARADARAILARPAVVTGYRLRHKNGHVWTWRATDNGGQGLESSRLLAVAARAGGSGKLYRLVVR